MPSRVWFGWPLAGTLVSKPHREDQVMAQLFDYLRRLATEPALLFYGLNAQLRMRPRARVPFSVRLRGGIRIRGRGEILLGDQLVLVGTIVPIELIAHEGARIEIGEKCFINYGASISAHQLIRIGKRCKIGHYVFIMDNDQHDVMERTRTPPSRPVVIEDDVWIASHAVILPGVRIGRNAVVGAGSIVTKDVAPYTIVAGNPARPVRSLEPPA